ncbi:mogroside I-E synthase [Physcomitrium patens]|uniref:Glycosyltransferase n=1 Tax=Physcomitrium patens TaxID=3218 RepID=A0A2K1IVG1_PHYPA|nr:UDP-glycosyltransferase 13-like [Physcomitrium patens]PNR33260.1 hypothetical protein PHYPA_025203 [Physcomitrium patens]|eukprot:XP_024357189.1 UDP-glycosyltransferase 13-like [Physcomitrella patens]
MESSIVDWTGVPHVVLIPWFGAGHTIPFLEIARRLAAEGIVITLVTTDRHVVEVRSLVGSMDLTSQGLPLRLLGLRDNMAHLSHYEWMEKEREDPEAQLNVVKLLQELIVDVGSPDSMKLRNVQPAAPPVCVLHDLFVPWAQLAAENLKIEKHMFYSSSASAMSCALQTRRLYQEGRIPITREMRNMVFTDIPGLPPIPALDLFSSFMDPVMYKWMSRHYFACQNADVVLINTYYDLEKPVLDALRNEVIAAPDAQIKFIYDIGPLLPESYVRRDRDDDILQQGSEETDPCILWLNTRPPSSVIYVSFGSMQTNSPPQLLEMALGLEASGSSFLWLVRPPDSPGMTAALGGPCSITEFLPSGFEDHVKERGMCYSGWAQQMRILKHPAIGGFFSHCGWNSTLEAVCAGVPILGWPFKAEQHLNCRILVDTLRVAIEVEGNPHTKEELESEKVRLDRFVSKEEIEKKVRNLMQEEKGQLIRENMQRLRIKSREVLSQGGCSRQSFEAYLRLLRGKRDNFLASRPNQQLHRVHLNTPCTANRQFR